MAKVTVSVRMDPETLERIDGTAVALGTTRGRLIAEVLDESFSAAMTPLDMARAIVDGNADKVIGYTRAVEQRALDAMNNHV